MEYIVIVGFSIFCLILLDRFLHNFWSRCGFVQLTPTFLFGNIGKLFRLDKSIAEIYGDLYEQSKKYKLVGLYFLYRPAILINDSNLIQKVLVQDFQHFSDHGLYCNTKYDPLSGNEFLTQFIKNFFNNSIFSGHLFSLKGVKWRKLRSKLTPLFSPGKLKVMFPTFLTCAINLQNHVENSLKSEKNVIEFRDLFARFTTDIIASVAFGFDNNSINEPNNIFRTIGAKVFKPTLKAGVRAFLVFLMPKINRLIGMKVADKDVEDFMFAMVKQTIEFRQKTGKIRNDFMQVKSIKKNFKTRCCSKTHFE